MSSYETKQLLCQNLKIKYRSILTLWIFHQHKCFDCRFNINSLKEKDYWWLEPNQGPRVWQNDTIPLYYTNFWEKFEKSKILKKLNAKTMITHPNRE